MPTTPNSPSVRTLVATTSSATRWRGCGGIRTPPHPRRVLLSMPLSWKSSTRRTSMAAPSGGWMSGYQGGGSTRLAQHLRRRSPHGPVRHRQRFWHNGQAPCTKSPCGGTKSPWVSKCIHCAKQETHTEMYGFFYLCNEYFSCGIYISRQTTYLGYTPFVYV